MKPVMTITTERPMANTMSSLISRGRWDSDVGFASPLFQTQPEAGSLARRLQTPRLPTGWVPNLRPLARRLAHGPSLYARATEERAPLSRRLTMRGAKRATVTLSEEWRRLSSIRSIFDSEERQPATRTSVANGRLVAA